MAAAGKLGVLTRQLAHHLTRDRKHPVTGTPVYRVHAGKTAKGRQHTTGMGLRLTQPEARQTQMVTARTIKRNAGMPVTSQHISTGHQLRVIDRKSVV